MAPITWCADSGDAARRAGGKRSPYNRRARVLLYATGITSAPDKQLHALPNSRDAPRAAGTHGSAKRAVRASVQHLRQAQFYRAGRTWPTHENQSVFFRIERAIPKPRTGRWLLRYAILLDELFDDAEQLGVSSGRQCQRSLHLTDNQALSLVPISRRDRALARCISLDEIVRALE